MVVLRDATAFHAKMPISESASEEADMVEEWIEDVRQERYHGWTTKGKPVAKKMVSPLAKLNNCCTAG